MRFPLGLTADLAMGRARQTLRGADSQALILYLPVLAGSPNSPTPVAPDDCLRAVAASSAPVIWIGGPEPLLHPEIGRLARRIVDAGRHVFVETDGTRLHRRIHEFRPVSRLFLTVRFGGLEERHDRRAGREGAFREALQGIRTAKLSGFLVCAHIVVYPDTETAELGKLRELLTRRDVDGFIVSAGSNTTNAAHARSEYPRIQKSLNEARALLPGRRWRLFSRLLNEALLAAQAPVPSSNGEPDRSGAPQEQVCEESVETS
jgi:hypothetical protein